MNVFVACRVARAALASRGGRLGKIGRMPLPNDRDELAFVLREPYEDLDEPSLVLLAEELEMAAESRRDWELSVEHASLVEAVRDVRASGRTHGGVYWTAAEERDDQAVADLPEHIDNKLEPFVSRLAGSRWRWEDDKRIYEVGVVGDPAPLREAVAVVPLADRVRIVSRLVSEEELEDIGEAVWAALEELEALGIIFQEGGANTDAGVYDLTVVGPDEERGRAVLRERFGEELLRVRWAAAAEVEAQPRAFATWATRGRQLTVHSWHDHNGEAPGGCTFTEHADRVEVELRVLVPTGCTTLIGGWQPIRETVELDAPLGTRQVIDRTADIPRPSWDELRNTPTEQAPDAAAAFAELVAAVPSGAEVVREVDRIWGTPVLGAIAERLRPRLAERPVLDLLERVLAGEDDGARRAVLVYLVEDTLLYGDEQARKALATASGPATLTAIATTNHTINGRRS